MHEIRVTTPRDNAKDVVRIARAAGIQRVALTEVYLHGPDEPMASLSVETSTLKARLFMDAIIDSPVGRSKDTSITARELRALLDSESVKETTCPMIEPYQDMAQDLWQLCHVTPSYLARTASGSILLANGMICNSPISIVIAALILPFLPPVLAGTFSLWKKDKALGLHAAKALVASILISVGAGIIVAKAQGGPILFSDFKSPLASFLISSVIGITAGLSAADDAGRRFLIGVAAAVQFGIYPVWFGLSLILGFPSEATVVERLETFAINLVTIGGMAVLSYMLLYKANPSSQRDAR